MNDPERNCLTTLSIFEKIPATTEAKPELSRKINELKEMSSSRKTPFETVECDVVEGMLREVLGSIKNPIIAKIDKDDELHEVWEIKSKIM